MAINRLATWLVQIAGYIVNYKSLIIIIYSYKFA